MSDVEADEGEVTFEEEDSTLLDYMVVSGRPEFPKVVEVSAHRAVLENGFLNFYRDVETVEEVRFFWTRRELVFTQEELVASFPPGCWVSMLMADGTPV